MYRNGIKRLLAVVLSLCGMLCLSWLFLILAIAIKLDSPGPVFFKQKRVGRGKRHFYILKFRTMRIDTPHDMPTHLLHDPDQYITRMGHFLRKTSLDELPQLWNIFVGDMAVIGPRPALWNQYDLLAERDALTAQAKILREFLKEAASKTDRYSAKEIAISSTVNVAAKQKECDLLAKRIRELDTRIQGLNWTTELL